MNEEARAKAAAGGLMPLDYLLELLRDGKNPQDVRIDAAKAAAPYVHARLAAVTHSGDEDKPVAISVAWQPTES